MKNNENKTYKGKGRKFDGRNKRGNSARNRNSKKDFREDAAQASFPEGPGQNDVSWYAGNDQLLRDTASFPYSYAVGSQIDLFPYYTGAPLTVSVPGVMAFNTMLTPGFAADGSAPINVAAKNIYSYVRHANSGHSNYESSDLMLYLWCMDSIYSIIAHAKRAYGVARCYSQVNRYYPEAVLTAMGFDARDVIDNLAQLRFTINSAINKVGSLAIPDSMPIFRRHAEQLFSFIYTDTMSGAKCQTYLFKPSAAYRYDPITQDTGGRAQCVRLTEISEHFTVSEIGVLLNELISAMIIDEDINIMSGDILKAFGADHVFKLASVPEDYIVTPVFNAEIMTQINNLSAHPIVGETGNTAHVTQLNNNLIYRPFTPGIDETEIFEAHRWVVNMPIENPVPGDTMVATRCLSAVMPNADIGASVGDMPARYALEAVGSEVVEHVSIYMYTFDEGGRDLAEFPLTTHTVVNEGATQMAALNEFCCLSTFDNHPRLYMFYKLGDTPSVLAQNYTLGDINTYTLMDPQSLQRMHIAALLSEFNVPLMGVWAKK